jgi:hypothetical protein
VIHEISCLAAKSFETDLDRMRLALLVLAGCNQVLELDPTTEIDAPPPVCGGALRHVQLQASEDATLIDDNNPQAHGDIPEVRVTASIPRVGLWKFKTEGALATTVDAQLVLPYLMADPDCGAGCGSCAAMEAGGPLTAFALTSAWTELNTTWNCRVGTSPCTTPWDQPGAGGLDRSPPLVTVDHVAQSDTAFPLGAELATLHAWEQGNDLSFVVVAGGDAQAIVPANTSAPDHLACRPAGLARLELAYCD